ncbi:MAG: hypothetical protein M1826_007383 [Phylliscum demangeonii]|nr:MAG: hypothetical protein M1826_007383 [Phylliscum demangeonii]
MQLSGLSVVALLFSLALALPYPNEETTKTLRPLVKSYHHCLNVWRNLQWGTHEFTYEQLEEYCHGKFPVKDTQRLGTPEAAKLAGALEKPAKVRQIAHARGGAFNANAMTGEMRRLEHRFSHEKHRALSWFSRIHVPKTKAIQQEAPMVLKEGSF